MLDKTHTSCETKTKKQRVDRRASPTGFQQLYYKRLFPFSVLSLLRLSSMPHRFSCFLHTRFVSVDSQTIRLGSTDVEKIVII